MMMIVGVPGTAVAPVGMSVKVAPVSSGSRFRGSTGPTTGYPTRTVAYAMSAPITSRYSLGLRLLQSLNGSRYCVVKGYIRNRLG